MNIDNDQIIIFEYKNWRGEISIRKVQPIKFYFGNTDYHKDMQWLMEAYDIDKNVERTFAITDILRFIK